MDQPKKVSEEPVADTIVGLDRFVILANTTEPLNVLRTITANNVINTLGLRVPTYSDNAEALAAEAPIGSMYKTATGELRIVVPAV